MRVELLLDSRTRSALAVQWLLAELEPAGAYGRRAFEAIEPFVPGMEREARAHVDGIVALLRTLDSAHIDAIRDALRSAPDATGAIARAGMGEVLADANLLEMQRVLDAAVRADALLAEAGVASKLPLNDLAPLRDMLERGRHGKFAFYLDDAYDERLRETRAVADRAAAEYDSVRGRLAQRVAALLGREDVSGDEFIVMRSDVRGKIPAGVRVVREAPTYLLCELEYDEAALAALERRDRADEAASVAEEAARARVSEQVRSQARALERLVESLGEIDVRLAQARFALRFGCVAPELLDSAAIAYTGARFLPLAVQLEREGRAYEPISMELDGVAVLTGPNMGGKSVALRTTGFVALLAAFGLPVPAQDARVGLFDAIAWLGIGTDEGVGGLLSSFAQEVVHLRELLESSAPRMLMLVDEFARTTTPREGKALLVALVRILRERGRAAFVATHLAGVARAAGVRHFAVRGLRSVPAVPPSGDVNEALAVLAASMEYAIVEVTADAPSHADAIALARLLGLDAELIAEAQHAFAVEG